MRHALLLLALLALASGCATAGMAPRDLAELEREVTATERAFARTLADRDHAAFTTFLADETVFFAGERPQRGKAVVAAEWRPFFEGAAAPFSWEPDAVHVLDSGTLALSTGPVRDPSGRVVGRFNSVWRREGAGVWRIVFDKGSPVCDCAPAAP